MVRTSPLKLSETTCRICLQRQAAKESLIMGIDANTKKTFIQIYEEIVGLMIDRNSSAFNPLALCKICESKLVTAYSFKLECSNSEFILSSFKPFQKDVEKIVEVTIEETNEEPQVEFVSPSSSSEMDEEQVCTFCGFCFTDKQSLAEHIVAEHLKKKESVAIALQCEYCNKYFHDLKSHMKRNHSQEKTKSVCPICGKLVADLSAHNRMHQPERQKQKEKCPLCHKEVYDLALHMATHGHYSTRLGNKTCLKCGMVSQKMELHMFLSHSNHDNITEAEKKKFKRHFCETCKKYFFNLKQHSVVHGYKNGEKKPFECSICGSSFKLKNNLMAHVRKHNPDKKFCCKFCDQQFVVWHTMRFHMAKVHGVGKRWICEICGEISTTETRHKQHVQRHTKSTNYECKFCPKRFLRRQTLQQHALNAHNVDATAGILFD